MTREVVDVCEMKPLLHEITFHCTAGARILVMPCESVRNNRYWRYNVTSALHLHYITPHYINYQITLKYIKSHYIALHFMSPEC